MYKQVPRSLNVPIKSNEEAVLSYWPINLYFITADQMLLLLQDAINWYCAYVISVRNWIVFIRLFHPR